MDGKRLLAGIAGGLAGGILFGLMMQMGGMLGMVAGLVGQEGAGAGWVVHLAISVLFGLGYGLVLGPLSRSWGHAAALGLLYGVVWWVLGALLIMPAWMDMAVFQVGEAQLQSLAGHLVYGLALGLVFHALAQGLAARSVPSRA